jgi:nucleotide-binding universal stress UspA family protein
MWTQTTKSIHVPFEPAEEGILTPAVDVAVSMADQARAHLTIRALSVKINAPFTVIPGFVGGLVSKANADDEAMSKRVAERLDAMLATVSCPRDVKVIQQPFPDLVQWSALLARRHDLTIMDAPEDGLAFGQSLFEELVFQSGRPVLVAPSGCKRFKADRIVVAWDGSARASRALHDAMPFLVGAARVELVSVINEKDLAGSVAGAEIAPHLARHGVKVDVVSVAMKDNAGHAIEEHAETIGADLIVSGAYVHSRWRQLILGGVTNSLLRGAKRPILMSY